MIDQYAKGIFGAALGLVSGLMVIFILGIFAV